MVQAMIKIAGLILVKIGVRKPITVAIIPHSSAWKPAASGVVATISHTTSQEIPFATLAFRDG